MMGSKGIHSMLINDGRLFTLDVAGNLGVATVAPFASTLLVALKDAANEPIVGFFVCRRKVFVLTETVWIFLEIFLGIFDFFCDFFCENFNWVVETEKAL